MAYGSFATYIHPNQRYGIIFGGNFKGMMMDIDQLMYQAVSRDNDSNELKGFIQSQGTRQSANEHLVPEQLFDDPKTAEKEVEGVSAVKAIQIAQQQGQTVYTITRENYSQIIPKLSLSANVMTDIRDNVAVGRTVTVHEKTIHYKGWKGSGYIIIDPNSGAGAYLIDGGANGGFAFFIGALVGYAIALALIGLASVYGAAALANPAALAGLIAVLLPTLVVLTAFIVIMIKTDKDNGNTKNTDCFISGMSVGFGSRSAAGLIDIAMKEKGMQKIISEILGGLFGFSTGTWPSRGCFME